MPGYGSQPVCPFGKSQRRRHQGIDPKPVAKPICSEDTAAVRQGVDSDVQEARHAWPLEPGSGRVHS